MKQNKITGIIGTVLLHMIIVVLLFTIKLSLPAKEEEGGVPVMLGDMALAEGNSDKYELTEVDVLQQPQPYVPEEPEPDVPVEEPMITQKDEPSIKIEDKKETKTKKKEKKKVVEKKKRPSEPKPVEIPKPEEKPKEKTEAEKRAEAERAAAIAATSKISNAFGKGSQMASQGDSKGKGQQGSSKGNSQTGSSNSKVGYGDFNLNGRSLAGNGMLPVPVYNVQEEGMVVVSIVVDPSGRVVQTNINKRTNTVNASLRKAAEDAARKAQFNTVDGVSNQAGTIVYFFKLK